MNGSSTIADPMNVVVAEGPFLERIFDETYPIWHDGLSRRGYSQWNAAQARTAWARERFRRFALVDGAGHLLASLKRYRYDVRLGERTGVMCGLGAVFTPPVKRGRGYASELIRRVLDTERAAGVVMAALFSEIGPEFYERLGFSRVPLDEVTVGARRRDGTPAMLVRAGDERDLDAMAALHATRAAGAMFALRRDAATIRFALARRRLFAGLSAPGTHQVEFFVAEEGASAVAYVVFSENQFGWTLEEAGDRDPAAARLGGMLEVLLAREPAERQPLIRAWWPRSFPVPPQLVLSNRSNARDLFMVRPLADVPMPEGPDDVFYWRSDSF